MSSTSSRITSWCAAGVGWAGPSPGNLAGRAVVVVDRDPERVASVNGLRVEGDATDDDVLRAAGIERASALVAALSADADNLYVTLSARRLRPDLFIVARARMESAEAKLLQAGADRVVNPQSIGGARMAALVGQPHVAAFLDLVMHDGSLEFRLAEVVVVAGSPVGRGSPSATPGCGTHPAPSSSPCAPPTGRSAPTRHPTR